MPELKDVHEKIDEIPEPFRPLYTEKNGKFELTGIAGIQTSANVQRLEEALRKEKNDHKAVRDALKPWEGFKHDEVLAKLDRIPELEAAAAGKLDENAIEQIVQKRVEGTLKSRVAPVERQAKQYADALAEREKELGVLRAEKTQRTVHDAVRRALLETKVLPEAHEDALLWADRIFEVTEQGIVVTRDQVGVTPGLDPKSWLAEIQSKRPHWWPANQGGGSRGSGPGGGIAGENPWSAAGWSLTKQGSYLKVHGPEKAAAAAAAAGSYVGATRPAKPAK